MPFECAVLNADGDGLSAFAPDPNTFAAHLSAAAATGKHVATFANLGGDSGLLAPVAMPGCGAAAYASLKPFLDAQGEGCAAQRAELWAAVAEAVLARLAAAPAEPLWVSTSGLGVAWLHVRLDPRPKYYTHAPYKLWPPQS